MQVINSGDTAWVLASAALVLFMTPGLAVFYGGMVRAKSALNMMMMSFAAIGVTTIIWVLYGYSLAFGKSQGGFIGNLDHLGLASTIDQVTGAEGHQIPVLAFAMFQLTFAIITVALLSGAIADRAKYGSWVLFVGVWITLVYLPVAHWAFAAQNGEGGWIIDKLKALDFAGGTVVEINSGAAALALALVLGKREGFKRDPMRPHNMPLVLLGAGMLWFGWFGFNAGSALSAGSLAATAMINTQIATAAAAMTWIAYEKKRDGKATTLGVASGAIAGAVAPPAGRGVGGAGQRPHGQLRSSQMYRCTQRSGSHRPAMCRGVELFYRTDATVQKPRYVRQRRKQLLHLGGSVRFTGPRRQHSSQYRQPERRSVGAQRR